MGYVIRKPVFCKPKCQVLAFMMLAKIVVDSVISPPPSSPLPVRHVGFVVCNLQLLAKTREKKRRKKRVEMYWIYGEECEGWVDGWVMVSNWSGERDGVATTPPHPRVKDF